MNSDYYLYIHYRSDGTPFYIGKGLRNRAYDRWNRNQHWHRIVNKHGLVVCIVANGLTNEYALKLEKRMISLYRSRFGKLSNLTDGGEGIAGFRFSEESRKKMSNSRKGRTFHPGYAAIMSKAKKGQKHSDEHKKNLSQAIKRYHERRRQVGLLNPFGHQYDKAE